jgi:predicted amidohydrolase YtcJ
MLIVNGRVWTGDRARPWAEAVAIDGDRIVAVGTTREIRGRAGATHADVIDAEGALVTPGFIDAHLHLVAGGFRLSEVSLRDANSRATFADTIRAHAARLPEGRWITGGDWNHERWGGELPTREWIDAATPRHPVWVTRMDGHSALANSLALTYARVTRETIDPDGGAIVRDTRGEPTGLLKENAMALVAGAIPSASAGDEDAAVDAAVRYLLARGVTSVHHMGAIPTSGTWHDAEILRRAHGAGRLGVRVRAVTPLESWPDLRDLIRSGDLGDEDGCGDAGLRLGMLKSFIDGSLGSRTAAFHDDYGDAPGERGVLMHDAGDLSRWMIGADAAGLQLAVHAIGDRANTLLLDLYDDVVRANGTRDRRLRVEHAQHLRREDVPRFAALGAIASMQPYHAIDDGCWAERTIGADRARLSYAWRSLADAGTHLAFGSDWFVAPPTPLEGIAAAVTRRTLDGRHPEGWIPNQRIDLETALHAYTTGAAFAGFTDADTGRIAPGLLADIVVLDRDLFAMPPEAMADARVAVTIAGGRVRYSQAPAHR